MQVASDFSASEDLTSIALEWLLRQAHSEAAEHAEKDSSGALTRLSRRADLIMESLEALRRRNPNRQLLLEALLLRLAHA